MGLKTFSLFSAIFFFSQSFLLKHISHFLSLVFLFSLSSLIFATLAFIFIFIFSFLSLPLSLLYFTRKRQKYEVKFFLRIFSRPVTKKLQRPLKLKPEKTEKEKERDKKVEVISDAIIDALEFKDVHE